MEACHAASIEMSCSSSSEIAFAYCSSNSSSGISSTHARTASPSSWRRASRPTESATARIASAGSMKQRDIGVLGRCGLVGRDKHRPAIRRNLATEREGVTHRGAPGADLCWAHARPEPYMSLSLIVGPPNSGRTGVVRERLTALLGRDPVLVVPTLEDASRFERELCERGEPVLGASILTFGRLFDEVARATGGGGRPAITEAQALHLVRRGIAATELRILARSARRPGFATELASAIDEIESSGLDPRTVGEHAAAGADRGYLGELASLYGAYVELRDELGLADTHVTAAEATAALRARPDAWGARPVLLYGFDDMTVEQLELVDALAAATEVTASVTFEDRSALAARSSLQQELRERGGEVAETRESNPANTDSEILFHIERGFLATGF